MEHPFRSHRRCLAAASVQLTTRYNQETSDIRKFSNAGESAATAANCFSHSHIVISRDCPMPGNSRLLANASRSEALSFEYPFTYPYKESTVSRILGLKAGSDALPVRRNKISPGWIVILFSCAIFLISSRLIGWEPVVSYLISFSEAQE